MKDKEKQFIKGWEEYQTKKKQDIEEMAQKIAQSIIMSVPYSDLVFGRMTEMKAYSYGKSIAKKLIKYYQPKLPENSVVLSREEVENMVNAKMKCINDMAIIANKETARQLKGKFVDILQEEFYNAGLLDSDLRKIITQRIINEL